MRKSLLLIAAFGLILGGCADRRLMITSDPAGALVTLNDVEVGRTPVEVNFTWFGVYDVRLQREGFETLATSAEARPELHDQPGLDALSALWPRRPKTEIRWHFVMEPAATDPDELIERALEVRALAPRGDAAAEEPTGDAQGSGGR